MTPPRFRRTAAGSANPPTPVSRPFPMRILPQFFRLSALLPALLILAADVASAQGPRGDRGGLVSMLRRDEVREELGLSEEQSARLDELRGRARVGQDFYTPYME